MNTWEYTMAAYAAVLRSIRPYGGFTKLSRNKFVNHAIKKFDTIQKCVTDEGVPITLDMNDYHGRVIYFVAIET